MIVIYKMVHSLLLKHREEWLMNLIKIAEEVNDYGS
jgi:hypothetical protein